VLSLGEWDKAKWEDTNAMNPAIHVESYVTRISQPRSFCFFPVSITMSAVV